MNDRDSVFDRDQIEDRTIRQLELDITNTPTDGQIIQINMPTGDFTAVDLGNVADIATMQTNIALNAFRIAINGSLTQFNMVDGIVDEYEDENSIDNANSVNESYDSVNDLYSPNLNTISASPFAHMKLENNTDEGSGANAVTDIGTPTYTSGHLNNALTLDGSTDSLNLDALVTDIITDTTGSFSIWVKADANGRIFAIGDANGDTGFTLFQTGNTFLANFFVTGTDFFACQGNTNATQGQFNHYVFTHDGITPRIYTNGVESTSFTVSVDKTKWLSDLTGGDTGRLGSQFINSSASQFLDGQIDDFRYYQNTVLSQADVDKLFNSGVGTEDTNPGGDPDNMTLISDIFTAEATPSNVRIVLFEEDVDAVTLNTDLKAFATRDAGQTFTTDFATDDKLDITSHGFSNDDRIMVTSSSQDLPAGLSSGIVYYVINATTNDFELSLTSGGSAVNITDDGTGTHTAKQVNVITLANDGEYQSGRNILTGSVDISGQPSGTSMEYELVTANNKDLKIHGTSLSWDT